MPRQKTKPPSNPENVRYFSKRLLAALEVIRDSPLTVVEAPMGYGKTEAVRAFLADSPDQVVWTGARTDSPEYFWTEFCQGLARAAPKAAEALQALQLLGFPDDRARIDEALRLLGTVPGERRTILVFDDCHLLPRSFIVLCEGLAREAPLNSSVVAITRDAWSEGLRLAARSPARLDRSLLALTEPEIREYYAMCGADIDLETTARLHERTEGWISALYLELLGLKRSGHLQAAPLDVSKRMREMVYDPLSEEAKDLLLTLTPLERFTADRASRLHGSDASALLEELVGKNGFVTVDREGRVYSPHAVFRQLLRSILDDPSQTDPERRRGILRACGDELRACGELASAMEAWREAGDFERALTALESDMSRNLVAESASFYTSMFKECPPEIRGRHLGASFKYALAAFIVGDREAFGTQMGWLADRLAAMPPGPATAYWTGEWLILRALTRFNDIEAMNEDFSRALELIKGPTRLYGTDSPWTLGCPSVLFMFHRRPGALQEELGQMRRRMPIYYQLASFHGAGAESLMEAEALYHQGDAAGAARLCEAGLAMAGRHNQLGNVFCALFIQMRLALLEGRTGDLFGGGRAAGLLAEARGLVARGRDGFLLHTADLCEGWIYAFLGLSGRIPAWLTSSLDQDSRLYVFARGYFPIVHGRARLLAGQDEAVIEEFGALLSGEAYRRNALFGIHARVYQACAWRRKGRTRMAIDALIPALEAALPDNLLMPFAENHDLLGDVLEKAASGLDKAASRRLEELSGKIREGRDRILAELGASEAASGLTRREDETLRLLAAGLSTREAAERMGVTIHTVRAHLKSAARKTGTSGRLRLLRSYLSGAQDREAAGPSKGTGRPR